MSDAPTAVPATGPKPKKSVALSGVTAGNTALCTVGLAGNDLHYRGYDILDFADEAEFEEIAFLLVHEKLPNAAELAAYKSKLKALRGLPAGLKAVLEAAAVYSDDDVLGADAFAPRRGPARAKAMETTVPEVEAIPESLERLEAWAIERSLRRHDGNVAAAARALGIGRATLYRKMTEYRIEARR